MDGHILSLLLLVGLASLAKASIYITLRNTSDQERNFKSYTSVRFYDSRFSSIDSNGVVGHLHQPESEDGCSPLSFKPPNSSNSSNWFALIEYFPTNCPLVQTVNNVQKAGYKLVIVADKTINFTQTNVTLTSDVRKLRFPIVIIDKYYVDYLIQSASSDFANPDVLATVNADGDLFILVLIMASIFVALPVCMICCALWCYWRTLRARHYQQIPTIQRRGRLSEHERIARRELIDSILRQLQELQLEGEIQQPLGAEKTRALPTKMYETSSTQESCAICVEDFKNKDILRVLPCKHFFHIKCIDEWLTNHSDVCPLCKSQVPRGSDSPRHPRGPMLVSLDETDDTDSETLLGRTSRSRQVRPYGSV